VTEHREHQAARDAILGAHVKSVLAQNAHISALPIHVEVNESVVRLKGYVDTEEHRREAEILTRGVPQVKSVVNELAVVGPGISGSPEVTQ